MNKLEPKHPFEAIAMRWVLCIGLALGLSACGTDMSDLQQFVDSAKSARKRPIPPLPEIKPHETFTYEAAYMRDPFETIIFGRADTGGAQAPRSGGLRPDDMRAREPLESYPLDSIRMMGTLERTGGLWALVRTTDGTIHRVTVGNFMGENHGKIVSITENNVELSEIVPDGLGGYMEREASLATSE